MDDDDIRDVRARLAAHHDQTSMAVTELLRDSPELVEATIHANEALIHWLRDHGLGRADAITFTQSMALTVGLTE